MKSMETKNKVPFRTDIVGSFLRPERLKEVRLKYAQGKATTEQLKEVEDEEIIRLVAAQREVGLKVATDGEFRRSWWHLDFFWGLNGVYKVDLAEGYKFHGEETRAETARLIGKIRFDNHPFLAHFKFLKSIAGKDVIARQTIPAPAQLLAELERAENIAFTNRVYPDKEELLSDIAKAYRDAINSFYNLGCRNLQFDDCTWGMFCDEKYWAARQNEGVDFNSIANRYLELNNAALEDYPSDMTITTHVCRGNYHSTWASSGGYEPIADKLFAKEKVSAFYLEFDSDRAGDFSPLRFVADDKKVVLGLVTSKSSHLEDKNIIIKRLHEAAKYVPLERLYLSPQCGFASTEEGNKLTEEQQWAKIRLVSEIAKEVWGE